jgi:uncharacterized LabA/DUF88 family protein
MTPEIKLALLIDGDNAEASLINNIINETSKFGRITVKRIYADWTSNRMNKWKEELNKFAIRPIQKFSYTTGKNSTDSAMIIDAMDLLHSKIVDGFCIVSSDSDYTGIAHRIREEGMFVMGIGKSNTPEALVMACENFIYTDILKADGAENTTPAASKVKVNFKQIDAAFDMAADEANGMALLSKLPIAIRKIDPTFDPRNYGSTSFRKFCETILKDKYEIVKHNDNMTLSLKRKE